MNPELHHLIVTYGYWLMAFGALIEGETFLLAGGIAAQQGILHIPGLLLLALVGSFVHDISFFMIGRFFGHRYFQQSLSQNTKIARINNLLERYGVFLIIALRFAYGFRTLIPTAIGVSPYSTRKFIFWDLVGGILWSCTFILGGYFLGAAFEHFLRVLSRYEDLIFSLLTVLLIFGVLAGFAYFAWKRFRNKSKS